MTNSTGRLTPAVRTAWYKTRVSAIVAGETSWISTVR
jgi:hypothetical protein